jgi:hypothetical protein
LVIILPRKTSKLTLIFNYLCKFLRAKTQAIFNNINGNIFLKMSLKIGADDVDPAPGQDHNN